MSKKSSTLATGLMAGLAAGLMLPVVAKKAKQWASSPEGQKALKEVMPSKADKKKMLDLWNKRGKLVKDGWKTVRKHLDTLVSTTQSQAEETIKDTKEMVQDIKENVAGAKSKTKAAKKVVKKTAAKTKKKVSAK